MIRGGEISLNAPIEMIRQVLAGTWSEYEKDGWHIVSCPMFTVMEKVCPVGATVLPLKPWRQGYADIVYGQGNTKQLVKPGQNTIDITGQSSFVRIVQYGQGDK